MTETEEYLQKELSDEEKDELKDEYKDEEDEDYTKKVQMSYTQTMHSEGKERASTTTYYSTEFDDEGKAKTKELGTFETTYYTPKEYDGMGVVDGWKRSEGGTLYAGALSESAKKSIADAENGVIKIQQQIGELSKDEKSKKENTAEINRLKSDLKKAEQNLKDEKDAYAIATFDKDGEWKAGKGDYKNIEEYVDAAKDDEDKESRELFRKNFIDDYIQQPFSPGNKLSTMGFLQSLGVTLHAFNEYQGISKLTGLLWDYVSEEKVAERLAQLQEDFCVLGGLKQCFTSVLCDVFQSGGKYFETGSDNYILAEESKEGYHEFVASINGEVSDKISFKGMSRTQLIELFGESTYVDGEKIDLTDATIDTSKLPFEMWLYNVQLAVNNPKDSAIHVNIEFRGPNRRARWFNTWRTVEKGLSVDKKIIKYSSSEYTQVCILFKEAIARKQAGVTQGSLWINEFCTPLEGAGAATSIEGRYNAAQALEDQETTTGVDGAGV